MSDNVAPFTVVPAEVGAVERISPSFVRVTFIGDGVDTIGTPGHTFDQRVKLVFPGATGELPDLADTGDDWYTAWLAVPKAQRGSMRTYSIRDLTIENGRTRIVIDFVLHLAEGATGPASLWASRAAVGDTLLLVGPRRGRLDGGGIEFDPGSGAPVLLAGDETAAPAIARILEDLAPTARGVAFIEIPDPRDALPIRAPEGVSVHWLARSGEAPGTALIPRVLDHLGVTGPPAPEPSHVEELVWETPAYSGNGELDAEAEPQVQSFDAQPREEGLAPTTYWIAGESLVVTTLRRHLVRDLGIPRTQVAFMGYWRIGVAMKG